MLTAQEYFDEAVKDMEYAADFPDARDMWRNRAQAHFAASTAASHIEATQDSKNPKEESRSNAELEDLKDVRKAIQSVVNANTTGVRIDILDIYVCEAEALLRLLGTILDD